MTDKLSEGWATAIIIVIFSLVISYFFLWSPANKEVKEAQSRVEKWQQRSGDGSERRLTADAESKTLAQQAAELSSNDLSANLQQLGIPGKNLVSTPQSVRVEAVGSLSEVASWISLTSGQTYLNSDGQLRGAGEVVRANYQIEPIPGDQYLLQAEFQLIDKPQE